MTLKHQLIHPNLSSFICWLCNEVINIKYSVSNKVPGIVNDKLWMMLLLVKCYRRDLSEGNLWDHARPSLEGEFWGIKVLGMTLWLMRVRSWWINIPTSLPLSGTILRYVPHSHRSSPVGLCLNIFINAHLLAFLPFISHLSIPHNAF